MGRLVASLFGLFALLATVTAQAADRAIIVMDASGSMWGQIDGKTKIEIARETLGSVLGSFPQDLELGLVAYGHREKGSCADIEEMIAPGTGNRDAISAAVNKLNPKGKTPLTDAVRRSAEALRYTEDKATVILITDGLETCEADPCAAATELEGAGVDFTAHVVGFGLTEEEGRQVACLAENTGGRYIQAKDATELGDALTQTVAAPPAPAYTIGEGMEDGIDRPGNDFRDLDLGEPDPALCQKACVDDAMCVAWTFVKPGVQADNARCWLKQPAPEKVANDCCISGLVEKTAAAVDNVSIRVRIAEGAPEMDLNGRWDIFPMNGDTPADKAVDGGYGTDFKATVEPGRYMLRYDKDIAEVETILDVAEGEAIDRELFLNAGIARLAIAPVEGGDVSTNARIDMVMGDASIGSYGPLDAVVPAGTYDVKGKLGEAVLEDKVTIEAGKTLEKVLVVAAGRLTVGAVYAEGGERVDTSSMRHDVLSAKKALDGRQKQWDGSYGDGDFMLPPGDYVIRSRLGIAEAETPVTVGQNELTEAIVNINAGVVAATAPGADRIDLMAGTVGVDGKRKALEGNYGEELMVFAPPGDYVVRVTYKDDKPAEERPVSVRAAERTEVAVE